MPSPAGHEINGTRLGVFSAPRVVVGFVRRAAAELQSGGRARIDFDQLLGNDGVVLAHDAKNGLLFVPLGKHTEDDVMYIAKVDIAQAKVTSAPKLTVDAGIAELLMLEYLAPQ